MQVQGQWIIGCSATASDVLSIYIRRTGRIDA